MWRNFLFKVCVVCLVRSCEAIHSYPMTHGGVNSLRKPSTTNTTKQEPELGPFGSTEALDVLNKATKLVLHLP